MGTGESRLIRHKAGGGRIADSVEVDRLSYIDASSIVVGKDSIISNSRLESSYADNAIVSNAILQTSNILNTKVMSADAPYRMIQDSIVEGCTIFGVPQLRTVRAYNSIVRDTATVINARLENAIIGGTASVANGEFKDCRIEYGVWTSQPKTIKIAKHGVNIILTECIDKQVFVGCRRRPASVWLRHLNKLCRIAGWDTEMKYQAGKFLYDIAHN